MKTDKDACVQRQGRLYYFKKILLFALPLMLTGILQSLYSAADLIVVGRFEGETALAAVGSTGSLTNLILSMFMGLSVGAGVCVAHGIGAKNGDVVRNTLHTSVLVAVIMGIVVAAIGFVLAPKLLLLMDTPENVLGQASLYVKIIFLGSPVSILYNYCAAMLRASGDAKHPLIFLSISGLVNVGFNLLLVVAFHMGVAGVAIATVTSQAVSCVLVLGHMSRLNGDLHFSFRLLRIHKNELKKILVIGIPSGIQGSLFALSNVIIQSSINGFGSTVVAGNSASGNIENFYYIAYHAFYDCALTFVGQSVGAKRYGEIKKIVIYSILNVLVFAVVLTVIGLIFKDALLSLYIADSAEAVSAASPRYVMLISTYFLCGIMEIGSGTLRGMGRSFMSTVISLLFACLSRIVWIYTVFKIYHTPECIYVTYPLTWILTSCVSMVFVAFTVKKLMKNDSLTKIY